jgi:hypothetical protein
MEGVKDHTYYEELAGGEELVSFTDLKVEGEYATFKNEYKVYLWKYDIFTTRLFRENWNKEATLKYKIKTETLTHHYINKSINIKIGNDKVKIYISKILIGSQHNNDGVIEKYDKTLKEWKDGKLSTPFIPIEI